MPKSAQPSGDAPAADASAAASTLDQQRLLSRSSADLATEPASAQPLSEGARALAEDRPAWIDHYRVLRLVGSGGMGQVLLARDTRLGRLVALKLLRADVAPSLAQSLLDEARITAKLAHANIVTIHGVGTYEGTPYLALAYVDGESLADRLLDGPVAEAEALRICADIAAGLTAAHQAGVTHCDLKPGNVLVSRDGQVQVADFGIARALDTRSGAGAAPGPGLIVGTPAYMAPEQWTGEAPTGAVDVWALALVFYELVTGQHALAADDNSAAALRSRILDPSWLPARTAQLGEESWALVTALLTRDPAARPTARQAGRRMRALLARAASGGGVDARPFPGLRPFDESHAAFFFGREREIAELLEKARTTAVLPVVGPSGVGKSSLVLAGLVPRLRERGDWTVVSLRPGAAPFVALSRALRGVVVGDPRLDDPTWRARVTPDALAESATQLNLVLHDLADATQRRVLLVVDQLEEVLTHVAAPEDRATALGAFANAADPVDPDVRVVFTIRDDFLGQAAVQTHMQRVLTGLTVVQPLDEARMVEAVQLAVERAGCRWESVALPTEVVRAAARAASPMPLLQFACAGLWDARDRQRGVLTAASLQAMGGVDGIIARHADQTLAAMTDAEVAHARAVLLALVAPDGTRRVVALDALPTASGGQDVVERLVAARLLALRVDDDGRGGRTQHVEIAHEAVVLSWPRLRRWLDHSVEARRALDELRTVARLWDQRGRPQTELWDDEAVAGIAQRLGDTPPGPMGEAFVRASREAGLRAARRTRRLRWAAMAAATTLALSAVVAAAVFKAQRDQVREQTARLVRAAANVGVTRFDVRCFDWAGPEHLDIRRRPCALTGVRVLQDRRDHPYAGGAARPDRWTRARLTTAADGTAALRVETTGGPGVLRLARRGCAPSQIPVEAFAGFDNDPGRASPATPLWVPTCAASAADMAHVPAGFAYIGGPGVPDIDARIPDSPGRVAWVDGFDIDRTELSNATWNAFARMAPATGLARPDYPDERSVPKAAHPLHPVTAVNAYQAAAACAWLGKRLPSSDEWTKAARGGLWLADGLPNPMPRRNLPWGGLDTSAEAVAKRANLRIEGDGWSHSAPVRSFELGATPYGLLHMAGNVSEWTLSPAVDGGGHRIVRDAEWSYRKTDGLHSQSVVNARNPSYFLYSLGFRCVAGSPQAAALPPLVRPAD